MPKKAFFNVLINPTNKKEGRFCSWKHPLVHCEPGKMGNNCENLIGQNSLIITVRQWHWNVVSFEARPSLKQVLNGN